MSRRDGPLGGLGVRAPPVRVTSVDESAMQAKLRELKVVMARERTARSEVSHQMEANGGRIWSSPIRWTKCEPYQDSTFP